MSVDIQEEQKHSGETVPDQTDTPRPPLLVRFREALQEINWQITLLTAVIMAAGWCTLFLSNNILQVLAGIVPVTAGFYLGRRVDKQLLLHGLILGSAGYLIGLVMVFVYGSLSDAGVVTPFEIPDPETGIPMSASAAQLAQFYLAFSTFAMIPFPAFGTIMAGRAEQRNREMREEVDKRGGRLEKPGVVRTVEDIRGLPLPQLGSYVQRLFTKKGFSFVDYHFIDKDKHLDMVLEYMDEQYLLRLSVEDEVRSGTVQSLLQDMKRRKISKGLVITSTEFSQDALKSAKTRQSLVLIDGQTLFDIAEQ